MVVDFRFAFFALISFINLRKSMSSFSVHSSDFVDRSIFFGSFIRPMVLKFEIIRNKFGQGCRRLAAIGS